MGVTDDLRSQLQEDLIFVRNMSSVGQWHPCLDKSRNKLYNRYGVDLFDHIETQHTNVWTYARLAEELDFCGCELLLIDAEGHDNKIIRSMIQHCQEQALNGKAAWPDIIVFETGGVSDKLE